ncbi:hypothetical protein M8312_05250 [Sphingomonas sp. KRR8]|uniref:hypothetical protein n=1 Tax=Sphingomonas sp. KRR8 TaxID=2942996 RepID=UPI0020205DFF|nr:hypothetical protein [Sphingomonas sp. KRR8]URD61916.1 hypothetical protein M8312_05250 [Sphingomonas sp. KRR8]
MRVFLLLLVVSGGCAAGAASAFAVTLLHPQAPTAASDRPGSPDLKETPEFVPVDVLLPLVFSDGQLAGYASLKLQLRVAPGTGEAVKERLPLLLNAVNLQTYRTPLASGADGRLPDLSNFRLLVQRCADQALGRGTIIQVAITEARTS